MNDENKQLYRLTEAFSSVSADGLQMNLPAGEICKILSDTDPHLRGPEGQILVMRTSMVYTLPHSAFPKMEKVIVLKMLQCIKDNPDIDVTVGTTLRILSETEDAYLVVLPFSRPDGTVKEAKVLFTKEPDFEGFSYANWFVVKETVIPQEAST